MNEERTRVLGMESRGVGRVETREILPLLLLLILTGDDQQHQRREERKERKRNSQITIDRGAK